MYIKNISFLEDVLFDIKIAQKFYEEQKIGLGKYFFDSILEDIEKLKIYAGVHQKAFGLYRQLCKKFPFGIYYEIKEQVVVVVAILDLRQNPKNIYKFLNSREF